MTYVEVAGITDRLDGASRPGHFRGVTTVVCKLFEIVRPNRAYFGQKDAAQFALLRKMVRDLDMDVEIVVCPIVREADGLAMSSRNLYLDPDQRQQALVLNRSLQEVKSAVEAGEHDAQRLIAIGTNVVVSEPGARLDYFAIVDPDTLEPVDRRVTRHSDSGGCLCGNDQVDRQHGAVEVLGGPRHRIPG